MAGRLMRGAIVGTGAVVEELHLPALRRLGQVELAAICEPDAARAESFQRRAKVPRAFASLDDMLKGGERIDFVDIATPAHTHYAIARQALDAGLHVLVEKPLALDAREGAELDAIARRKNLRLCVLQTYRFRAPMQAAQELLSSGGLGTLSKLAIVSRWGYDPFIERSGWNWVRKAGQLLMYELGIHYVDLALHLAGPLRAISGFHAIKDEGTGRVTAVSALLEHENGAITDLDVAVLTSSRFTRIDLFGSKCDAAIKLFPEGFAVRTGSVHPLKEIASELRRTVGFASEAVTERARLASVPRRARPHLAVMSGFVDAIQDPALDVPVPATSAVRTLEVLDSFYERISAPAVAFATAERTLAEAI